MNMIIHWVLNILSTELNMIIHWVNMITTEYEYDYPLS